MTCRIILWVRFSRLTLTMTGPQRWRPMGEDNGYQHLYLEGQGKPSSLSTQFDWLVQGKFYTLTTAHADDRRHRLHATWGQMIRSFNLRSDAGLMLRRNADRTTPRLCRPSSLTAATAR